MKEACPPPHAGWGERAKKAARNPDGTFKRVGTEALAKPSSARSGKTRAPSEKPKPKGKIMRIIMAILHEVRELLWPSDSEEMGIKRGYRDGRDQG